MQWLGEVAAIVTWLVLGLLYWRRRSALPVLPGARVLLLSKAGALESVRHLNGPPPNEITRSHGRAPTQVYTRQYPGWVYRSET